MAKNVEQAIRDHAKELGVDPDLAVAIAQQESGLNESARSPRGAQGVMQVMPGTSKELAPKYGPDTARQGVGYFGELMKRYKDLPDPEKWALAGYNAGPGRVGGARMQAKREKKDFRKFEDVESYLPPETRKYVPGVLSRRKPALVGVSGIQSVEGPFSDDPLAELESLANQSVGGDPEMTGGNTQSNPNDLADLEAIAGGNDMGDLETAAATPRSMGEAAYGRFVQGPGEAMNRALGGLPKSLAGAAGALSVGDTGLAAEAFSEGGGTKDRLKGVAMGLLELALTGKFPRAVAAGKAIESGVEGATGSRTAGDIAGVVAGLGPAAVAAGKVAIKGGKAVAGLLGGETLPVQLTRELGANTTAQAAGKLAQDAAPGAISAGARKGSSLYEKAQRAAASSGVKIPGERRALIKAAHAARRELKGISVPLPAGPQRAIKDVLRAGRRIAPPEPTKGIMGEAVMPGPSSVGKVAPRDIPVDEAIRLQSTLRREINSLPFDHPARKTLSKLAARMDAVMREAAKGTSTGKKLDTARQYYKRRVIPTRKTLDAVRRAKEPEAATDFLTAGKRPTRFQRFEKALPKEAEAVRSAAWNKMIDQSQMRGKFDVTRFSAQLPKSQAQLDQFANTAARKLTVKAVQEAARRQMQLAKMPVFGPLLREATRSEVAARVLYRLSKTRQGSPGWNAALKKAGEIVGKTAALETRAVISEKGE